MDKRIKGKLTGAFEEREFRAKDAVLLVAAMSVAISLIVFIPQMAIMTVFLFSYSMLLFMFTYIFSDFQKGKSQLFFLVFVAITLAGAAISIFSLGADNLIIYGALALLCLSGFAFISLLYEERRKSTKERWYLAILPPALFVILYLFYSGTSIWFPYLLDMYGIIFAVLITLYLGSLFTWKTTLIFVVLLTAMDIVLVLITGTMVSAASHVSALQLPVLVTLRTFPAVMIDGRLIWMSLGLGDFFFAGLIAVQSMRRYGQRFGIVSVVAMTASFLVFEAYLLTYNLRAFPGTVMIVAGWIPVLIWRELTDLHVWDKAVLVLEEVLKKTLRKKKS
jgi:hypothetical protein